MSKRRLLTLLVGVLLLLGLTLWRLGANEKSPPVPLEPLGASTPVRSAEPHVATFSGQTMGTTFTVKYLSDGRVAVPIARATVQAALDEVDATMSTYRPRSEISMFNQMPPGRPFVASEGFWSVLRLARQVHDESKGAFDITVRPLVRAYGFGAGARETPPDAAELEDLRSRIGMDLLVEDDAKHSIEKTKEGVEIDLGAIAKGYGVDQAAHGLERLDVENYMVEVGGEIRVLGEKAEGQPWVLAIEEPTPDGRKLHATLSLPASGAALATSGDYRNFVKRGDGVVSHTVDPRSGTPTPRRTASVSVVRPTAAEADALATALSVLEPTEALALADESNWAVYILVHRQTGTGFDARKSRAFRELHFEPTPPP